MITELKDNQIFVFGSNLLGNHLGGAAKQAYEQFGAEWGVGEGLTGQCYAFPTLDKQMNKIENKELLEHIKKLIKCCEDNQDKTFLLTAVGTGICGHTHNHMICLFNRFELPKNLVMPLEWTIKL
jgi:hypothetical protein